MRNRCDNFTMRLLLIYCVSNQKSQNRIYHSNVNRNPHAQKDVSI